MNNSAKPASRVQVVDALRGFAAMAVALFHFTHGNPTFMRDGLLYAVGAYGWSGVDVFFVISGFVIPLALSRSDYRVSDFFAFLARRVVRLDPPYFVSLAVVIALAYVSSHAPGFAGAPFTISWRRLFLHFGYLNDLFGVPWYGVVYWTLALELQFYLLIGILFPLIASRRAVIPACIIAGLAVLGLVLKRPEFLFAWICPFLLGIVVFRFRTGLIPLWSFLIQSALLTVGIFFQLGGIPLAMCVLAWVAISFIRVDIPAPVKFFGAISYSLYLLHVPVGGRVINIASRFDLSVWGKIAAVLAAFAVSILAAYFLQRFGEAPAQRLSRRIAVGRAEGR